MTYYVGSDLVLGDDGDDEDEELGLDEILGDDDDDEELGDDLKEILGESYALGGKRRRKKRRKMPRTLQRLLRQVALAKAAGGAVVRPSSRNQLNDQMLPFSGTPATLVAGTPLTLEARPLRLFLVENLWVPSRNAADVVITAFNLDQNNQFPGNGAISAQLFSEVMLRASQQSRTLDRGSIAAVTFSNISGVDITNFAPAFSGKAVY